MSTGVAAAGVVTMKTSGAFPQSNSQLPKQHLQNSLQSTNAFDQQLQLQQQQQQHLLQQQQQQQQQQLQQHNQNQHAQLHRLSQPHLASTLHSNQSVAQNAPTNHATHSSVFPNAEFFQTLQQTAAAALPTVLPYDQSQYIGQLMYFPYPTAAAAAANGLFNSSATDAHHMSTPGTQAALINQASGSAGQLLGSAGIVSAAHSGVVTLNNTSQVQNAGQLFASGTGIVGIGTPGTTANSVASASLAPLFTTAHFYPQQHSHQSGGHQQLQLQHHLQHHPHTSLPMQHIQSLTGHSGIHLPHQATQSQQSTATVLLPAAVSSTPQLSLISSHQSHQPAHSTPQSHVSNNCEGLTKNDEKLQSSTPAHTPQKPNDQELLSSQSAQLGTPSQGNNSSLDANSTTIKRDNTSNNNNNSNNSNTGHFVCTICGREFGMRCRLIAHTRRHTGERPFPCADCGRAFSDRGNLQRHRYTHSSQPRFHCTVCGKSFRQASCLSNHRRFHCAGATGRPCPFCQRSFRSSSSLQMHIRWKHRADAAAAVAAAAAAAAASGSSSLSEAFNHLPGLSSYTTVNGMSTMSVNGVDSVLHSTPTCIGSPNKRKWRRKPKPKQPQNAFGKLTGDGLNILAGITLAEGIDVNAAAAAAGAAAAAVGGPVPLDRKGRPCNYPCPACPRRFAFQCRLAAHLRCHTNIRPFMCTECGRAFTQRGYLVRHAAVHKLDRPFSCGLCDRSYKHYGSLVNHRRTHSKGDGSSLGTLGILSTMNSNIGTLSSLEEVVTGALAQSHKADASDPSGASNVPTTITLLPVSKVEEILPGDLNGSVQQVCLPSGVCGGAGTNLLSVTESQEQQSASSNQTSQNSVLPHQLTATAVWPILATGTVGNNVTHTQLIPSTVQQSRQATMISGSHFSTITISPTQSSNQQQQQHSVPLTASRPQSNNASSMLSAAAAVAASSAAGGPTFVTVPLFSNSQSESDGAGLSGDQLSGHSSNNKNNTNNNGNNNNSNNNNSNTHHQFHTPNNALSDSTPQHQQQQHHQIPQTSQLQHNNPNSTQAANIVATSSDNANNNNNTNATGPVLHVLQPSPSIFFSPYYLPHSAASQM